MTQKKRNWAFVLYPESAPSDWRERLQLTGLSCCISPLHDLDFNSTGERKKPHYHIIVCYSGPTSYNVVKGLTDSLNQPIPQALEQVRGYYRYLTHQDNPEKAQYSDLNIETINGFNIRDFIELSASEVVHKKKTIQLLIRDLEIIEYSVLMDYLLDNSLETEYEVAANNTMFFSKYIASIRHRAGGAGGETPAISGKKI